MSGRVAESHAPRREACRLSPPGTRIQAIRLVLLAEALLADSDLGASHVSELTAVLAEAREIVARIGDELGIAHVDNTEAQLLILTGDLDGAEALLQRATDVLDRRPDDTGEGANAIGRARLNIARGEPGKARPILESAIQAARANGFVILELEHQLRLLGLGSGHS